MGHSGSRSWSSSRWIRTARNDALVTVLACAVAAAGFYFPGVPLVFAVVGFLAIVLAERRGRRYAIALGWHVAAFVPIWVGFLNRQFDLSPAIVLLLMYPFVAALAFSALNAGIAAAISAMIPWHVGSLVLVAGDLWPGTGVIGVLLVPFVLAGLDMRSGRIKAATAACAVVSSIVCWLVHEPSEVSGFSEVEVAPQPALTTASWERRLLDELLPAKVVFLGENVIDGSDPYSVDRWCRHAALHRSDIYVGVLDDDGRASIHRFRGRRTGDCRPEPVHERVVALPGQVGDAAFGWEIGAGGHERVRVGPYSVRWLICFEAFSPVAWLLGGALRSDIVVIAANDRWTRPVPVHHLRQKVGQSMARLWGSAVIVAETSSRIGVIAGDTLSESSESRLPTFDGHTDQNL